ncbi:hypothetical protein [Wolbachia endosymbiont of Chironomus riparius]|uniref:hypothetical protein n=1 Tax=Wolbachia endosymbiont of Chironomus riparius TaxID=2883238 RepID=UPI00209EF701|nr:hypothetical protein [Wolbachia endosymbiont of Chironomus riparius]
MLIYSLQILWISDIERKEDRRKNVHNGIFGYYSTNPKIDSELKLNIIATLDIGVDINKIFTIERTTSWINLAKFINNTYITSANVLLNHVKKFGNSGGYRISSDERDYIQFILDANTLTIVADKKKAIDYYKNKEYHPNWINTTVKNTPKLESIVGYIYDTIAKIFSNSCEAKVDEEGNLELTLTHKNVFMTGEILNQAIEKIEEKAAKAAPKADEEDNKKYIRNNVSHDKPSERENSSSQNETSDNIRTIDINVTEVKNTNMQINNINSEEESSSLPETEISTHKILNSRTQDSDLHNADGEISFDCPGEPIKNIEEKEVHEKSKLRYAGEQFAKIARHSNHPNVPKEEQLSIDLGNQPRLSVIEKILYWIENNFKYFFPAYNLFPEVGTKDRKISGTDYKVKYFTQEEQTQHTKEIHNGKLYRINQEGKREDQEYDTSNCTSKGKKGCVAYVVTLGGKLITHEHVNFGKSEYLYRHSTLTGGGPVICSGLMKVENGKITYIDNNSGHYKPKSAHIYRAVKILKPVLAKNAKISCSGSLLHFIKNICIKGFYVFSKISTTKEPVEKFLNKMEKAGKNGLTKQKNTFKL